MSSSTIRSLDLPTLTTTTDSEGYFTLVGLPPGENYIEYDNSTTTPNGGYASYRAKLNLIENITKQLDRPIYFMQVDLQGEVQVDPNATTELVNPNISVSLTIPPQTVMTEEGSAFDGMLSVSEVPNDYTPGVLSDTLDPSVVVTLQPMGLIFNQPVSITFPNVDNLPPGSEVDIWSLDHSTGEFFYGGHRTGERGWQPD